MPEQMSLAVFGEAPDVEPFEVIPGGIHHVPRFSAGSVEFRPVVPAECVACAESEFVECATHFELGSPVGESSVLRSWEKHGSTRKMLVSCPAVVDGEVCGVDLTGREHTSAHIASHSPVEFGLSAIGERRDSE